MRIFSDGSGSLSRGFGSTLLGGDQGDRGEVSSAHELEQEQWRVNFDHDHGWPMQIIANSVSISELDRALA